MKVLIPVSTMLKYAFFVAMVAAIAGFAAGHDLSGPPSRPPQFSTTDHSKVVRVEPGKEVFFPCRPTPLSS